MFRLKRNFRNHFCLWNFNCITNRLNLPDILCFECFLLQSNLFLGLKIAVLYRFHIHHFNGIRSLALLLNNLSGEGHFHLPAAAPNLGIQQLVSQPEVDVVGVYGGYRFAFLTGGLYDLILHLLADSGGGGGYAGGEYAFFGADGDHHSVIHGEHLLKGGMFSAFRHHHVDALLLGYFRYVVPDGLGTVAVVCDGVGYEFLAVGKNGVHGIADLVLYTKV